MTLLQIFILAMVQGLTEFIPVSSSAHLILVPAFMQDWPDQGPIIDIAVHLGSLGAVLFYFKNETAQLFRGGIDTLTLRATSDRQLFLFIAVGTIPIIIAALVLVFLDLSDAVRSPTVIGIASIVFGVILWFADRRPTKEVMHSEEAFSQINNWRAVLTIAVAQAIAIVPGTSRSGITITAARFLGVTRPEAARFSMLLAIPTILAFAAFAGLEIFTGGFQGNLSDIFIAIGLAFVTGYLAITVFMRMTEKMSFTPFVIYRILLGIFVLSVAPSLIN